MPAAPGEYRLAVVAPTYNNDRTVAAVLRDVDELGLPVLVVNDGSTDATREQLAAWLNEPRTAGAWVLHHERNRGKAAALRTGFEHAQARGFTHVATIDTDLQHDASDIPRLMERSRAEPGALILGARRSDLEGTPARSLIGRRLSNAGIRLASGVRVEDSQSGLRIYPLALVQSTNCRSEHYGFETEIIVQAGWCGAAVIEVPITSRYLPIGERVSHFNPWMDSLRCLRLHARLLLRAVIPAQRTRLSA